MVDKIAQYFTHQTQESHLGFMKTLIKLQIEKFQEKGQEYFVATSEQIQGLVAEGNTIEEVVAIASDLARILIELD